MSAGTPQVHCRRCDGAGEHDMPPAYAKTYALLTPEWQTGPELLSRAGGRVKQSAFANRLAWLRDEGFAESRINEYNHRVLDWRLRA